MFLLEFLKKKQCDPYYEPTIVVHDKVTECQCWISIPAS